MATVNKYPKDNGDITFSKNIVDVPSISKEVADEIIKLMPKEKIEETIPKEPLCKMMIKGKASKLHSIIDTVVSTYHKNDSSYSKGFDKDLVITLMIEEGEEKSKNS